MRRPIPLLPNRDPHGTHRLVLLAALLGVATGGAAWVLVHLIAFITNVALVHRVGWELPRTGDLVTGPGLVVVAVAGGLVVSALASWAPTIRGHGIPEAMEAVLTNGSRIPPRTAVAKPLASAVAIGTGGPFGAEGPVIVTGGALGSLLGQALTVTPAQRKVLLCCGAAAGMAATFGAPLAAVILALELLLFEFSLRALVPLLVATSVAGGMHAVLLGAGPLFEVPDHRFIGIESVPAFAAVGLACGLLAAVVGLGLSAVESGFARLPLHERWHPVVGALGFALVGLVVPRALGVGYDEIGAVLGGRLAVGSVAVLLVAKVVAWWVALGSGTSGGTLAPLLLVGGCAGALLAGPLGHLVPGPSPSTSAFALVAMAATFGAATRTPVTSVVFLFELTRDYDAVLPLMGATVVAVLVAGALSRESLMTEKLARRGIRVSTLLEADPWRAVHVGEVMRDPLTDGDLSGRAAGVQRGGSGPDGLVTRPGATVRAALDVMVAAGVDRLAVVEDGRQVGVVTRDDAMAVRAHLAGHEQPEPGWLSAARRTRPAGRMP